MPATAVTPFEFDNSFVRELEGLYEPWTASPVEQPELLVLNEPLARQLGVDPEQLRTPGGVDVLVGNEVPEGAQPVAMAYAGHQFASYSPRLGDGRALLLGEVLDVDGHRVDLHLKGSGRTPFARGGDGKAAVGPMLREYLMGEAMHALGIPTTRCLAVVATGELVHRDTVLPGAVMMRVASSHLRIGTFQYAAATGDVDLLRRLADHAIARHHPGAAELEHPYLGLFDAVLRAQADLVARWMLVGFVHGVLNTDNVTISGETIDYGPCAFMDAYDPATVFSSIDHAGRYAFGNQPPVTQWNLARFAETLLPLIDDDVDRAVSLATDVLQTFPERFRAAWDAGLRAKLGLPVDADRSVGDDLLALLHAAGADWTGFFRTAAAALRSGDDAALAALLPEGATATAWVGRWRRGTDDGRAPTDVAAGMDRVNPRYIPRNHLVEQALDAATAGDLGPFTELVEVLRRPFERRDGLEGFEGPAPEGSPRHVTYCGT
jgi:uncharacterized protein YdiU (UPF0061 family)